MRNKTINSIALLLLLGAGYYGYAKVYPVYFAPCGKPLTYTITFVDARFGISKADVQKDLQSAEAVWEQPSGHDLFALSANGKVSVSLVFDYRQEAINRLKALGITIDSSKKSYDQLKARYNSELSTFNTGQSQVQALVSQYDKLNAQYQQDVRAYNSSKRQSQAQYYQLQQEQNQINTLVDEINTKQDQLKKMVDDINALANLLNQLASELNLDVAQYNQVGQSTGSEFQEGVYKVDGNSRSIEIYEFGTQAELVRVLAHELGHARGLDHVDDKDAIMYKINQSTNMKPTAADIAELDKVCKF